MDMIITLWGGPGDGKEIEINDLDTENPDYLYFSIVSPNFEPKEPKGDLTIIPPDMIDKYTYVRGPKIGKKWVYEIQNE